MSTVKRREFVAGCVAAGLHSASAKEPQLKNVLNYNPKMEYRRLGKTGLIVSAVCLGGHWKRAGVMIDPSFKGNGASEVDFQNLYNPTFITNRRGVVDRCIEVGINYVDACSPQEILAYSKVLHGRRDRMYLGFSWYTREPRFPEWRSGKKLLQGFEQSLKEAGLEYADVWRISLPQDAIPDMDVLQMVEDATVEALDKARQQGKARFTGISSHNRVWLKWMITQYSSQIQVVLFPYTAASKQVPYGPGAEWLTFTTTDDSIFDAVKKNDTGVFGIKPFGDNSLFVGDSSPNSPHAEEDDRRARLAIRYILGNPLITAPLAGLISPHQVDNVAQAVAERRKLNSKEKAELGAAGRRMWANLKLDHQWLKGWEYV
jgi:aryl-alcohol dehydrogenase-like predicted oxidoreductase